MLVKELLQFLISIVDVKLFESIGLKYIKMYTVAPVRRIFLIQMRV